MPEELLDTFNVPNCHPSKEEVEEVVDHETSCFHIQKLEYIHKHPFSPPNPELILKDAQSYAKWWTGILRGGLGGMLSAHMAPELTEALMERFSKHIEKDYLEKKPQFPMIMNICMGILIRK